MVAGNSLFIVIFFGAPKVAMILNLFVSEYQDEVLKFIEVYS